MFFAKLGDGATGDDGISDDDSGEIEIIEEKGTSQRELKDFILFSFFNRYTN